MKILLVYPEYPETFWGFKHALKFTDAKVAYPPLGLLTVASMLPEEWQKKLVDLNVESLREEHLKWADYVFISAMELQKKSAVEVIRRCKRCGVKIVAGGPLFTENYQDFKNVDHLFLGEAELTVPGFLKDLENNTPRHLYTAEEWADLEKTPVPMWDLADLKKYFTVTVQYSRGCPFDCEFCQITKLFGRNVRTKTVEHVLKELNLLYEIGRTGNVFFVDDNFIGNKHKLKSEILPAIISWMEERGYPFQLFTQASINLADDEELMRMMVEAGFDSVFVGIETIDDDCLAETGKFQNRNRDLVESVKRMQRAGLQVWSGFIVGFDNDKETIFDRMIRFIQDSGVTLAMVGLLTAYKGTRLIKRLEAEGRLLGNVEDDKDFTINFIPKMNKETLLHGYGRILKTIYSPEQYYLRIITFLKEYNPSKIETRALLFRSDRRAKTFWKRFLFQLGYAYSSFKHIAKTIFYLGIFDEGRLYYWKLFFWSLFTRPRLFPVAMSVWAYGYHFRKARSYQAYQKN